MKPPKNRSFKILPHCSVMVVFHFSYCREKEKREHTLFANCSHHKNFLRCQKNIPNFPNVSPSTYHIELKYSAAAS